MKKIAFIVNGGPQSALGHRARSFAAHLSASYDVRIAYREPRKIISLFRFCIFLLRFRPELTYTFDMAYSGVGAALLMKAMLRNHVVIDTGDVISALARSMGRGKWRLWATDGVEKISLQCADCIVVRGTFHRDLLRKQGVCAELVRDGVDADQFAPRAMTEMRRRHSLEGVLTIGIIGSSIWNDKLGMCYGWELVEILRLLKDEPVKGVFIGGGSGIPHLQARCREYGVENNMLFLGFIDYEQLPDYLSMMDICLSTQTNDLVGNVRTTGKLPLYLASGRYVLASKTGEAALVLQDEMLVEYNGVRDQDYPIKLAERIRRLLARGEIRIPSQRNIALARELFDYAALSKQLAAVIQRTLQGNN
jgi:glycosyltransferase involved in cell wall biosynthesis